MLSNTAEYALRIMITLTEADDDPLTSDEKGVYFAHTLNGTRIGYLSTGPDNGLNGGDAFSLYPALLINGQNTLKFRQRVAGWK